MAAVEEDMLYSVVSDGGATQQQSLDFFRDFSKDYDKNTSDRGYKGPAVTAMELLTHFPTRRDIKILDCGAGTGLVGEELLRHGFTEIDAVDPSKDMLSLLEKKHIYKKSICDFLGTNRLPIEDDCYDCVTIVGTIMVGCASHECFPELIRVVKPGGLIVVATRAINLQIDPRLKEHLEKEMQRLHDNGSWQWLKRQIIPNYLSEFNGYLATFKVL